MELFIGIVAGGLISWVVTHLYYKKSLSDQREAWENNEEKLLHKI